MTIHLHRSNRTEALVEALVDVVRRPLAHPLAPECIVVQGRGMERWLTTELAGRLGVWAHAAFPFPRRIVERALAGLLGTPEPGVTAFDPEALTWAIAAVLPSLLGGEEFAPLRRYLAADERRLRLVELAERIAATFDQYVLYRPRMVLAWERGLPGGWQATLWRRLVAAHGATHVAARAAAFLDAMRRRPALPAGMPERLSLFGISTLPPLYLEVLGALAAVLEVHLFVLSASREYWGEIRSRREILRELRRAAVEPAEAESRLHLSEGHPLLASLGRVGRDFQQALEAAGDYREDGRDRYLEPSPTTMLRTLQADMLHLRHRRPANSEAPPRPPEATDDSIQIHACHGPMREVEVLHDQILACFDDDPTLRPGDVIVLCPSIDVYAPFIEAVFGSERHGRPQIPFRVADRHRRAGDETYDALCRVLDVLPGRWTATAVMDLLELDAVRARFGISVADLELIRRWVQRSGVRWGVDAGHRMEVGYPAIGENTWRFGLDRLLLGYAMPGGDATVYHGVLPFDDVEGSETEVLGRLAAFCDRLFECRTLVAAARPLGAWRDELQGVLAAMVDDGPARAEQHLQIREALGAVAARASATGFDAPVALESARAALERALAGGTSTHGFLAGGVTFSALVPMRSIPFKVVCLLGMNDDAFPHVERPLGFDLMAQRPLPGDRTRRDDDRYMFLEALLAARDRLIVTYVGRSVHDDAALPPAVLVSELLDVLAESFTESARGQVEIRHPLQAFSPAYFRGDAERNPRLFSYAVEPCAGARSLLGGRRPAPPLLAHPLPGPRPACPDLDLDELASFLEHPVRGLLRDRLGLRLGDDLSLLDDREPLALAGLEEWQVGDRLLARALAGADLGDVHASVRASGALPPGRFGVLDLERLVPQVQALLAMAARLTAGGALPPLEIDVPVGGRRIRGALGDLWPQAHVRCQFSKLGRGSEVRLWVRHLVLALAAPEGYPRTTAIVGRDASGRPALCRFRPVAAADGALAVLVGLYEHGQRVPLPCFPMASRRYAEAVHGRGSDAQALAAAATAFGGGSTDGYADLHDPYVARVYAGSDPFACAIRPVVCDGVTLAFGDVARHLYGPLLAHREVSG